MLRPHAEKTAQIAYGAKGAVSALHDKSLGTHIARRKCCLRTLARRSGLVEPSLLGALRIHTGSRIPAHNEHSPMLRGVRNVHARLPCPRSSYRQACSRTRELARKHVYSHRTARKGNIVMGPAMSQSIAYAVLSRCERAARILNVDTRIRRALSNRDRETTAPSNRLRRPPDGVAGRIQRSRTRSPAYFAPLRTPPGL